MEAVNVGTDAVGVDVNPLACLISRVKTRPLSPAFSQDASTVISNARQRLTDNDVEIPDIPNLDHWFGPIVQLELAAIVSEIKKVQQMESREALEVTFSRIVTDVSFQESDTRYAAVAKKTVLGGVLHAFRRSADFIERAFSSTSQSKLFGKRAEAVVLNRDTLTLTKDDLRKQVGIVVTSPPYPNAYEYWLYHKYRMYWLGMDPIKAKHSEIGARPHYFKANAESEIDFEQKMRICFDFLAQVMSLSAKACFIMSDSIIRGKVVDNADLLTRAAKHARFGRTGFAPREIPTHRRSFNVHRGRQREYLMVFTRS